MKLENSQQMAFNQQFLEQITGITEDLSTWNGHTALMEWIKRQTWRKEFLGDKIPSRLLNPEVLASELVVFLMRGD